MNKIISIFIGINFLVLAGCSTNAPVTTSTVGSVKKEQVVTVKKGTITGIKDVAIQGTSSAGGRTVGAVAGSVLGSAVPYAGSIIGSMVGSAVGGEAEKAVSKKPGYEITLQLDSGESVIVTQLAETKFKTGDKVQLIMQNNLARVAHLQDNS